MEDSDSWAPIGPIIPSPPFGAVSADQAPQRGDYLGADFHQRMFNLGLPSTQKSGIIHKIAKGENPILVSIYDVNHRVHTIQIPYSIFRQLQPEPSIGRTLVVTYSRRPEDHSNSPTRLQSIKVY